MKIKSLLKTLGPGLLYAGAAVGVSHLVQSTRAGASYGFELIWVVIAANIIKYPFFEFAPRYASSTGKSLVDGYNKTGKWALGIFALLTLSTMFALQAAVTVVTAALLGNIFGISLSTNSLTAIILFFTMFVLLSGKFSALDKMIKVIILTLTVSTLIAVIAAFEIKTMEAIAFDWTNALDLAFLIALVGWMPGPIDISTWHSSWTVAKMESSRHKPSLKESLFDFNFGYIGTAFLAMGFVSLGAFVMYGSGKELSSNGVEFAGQLIDMYTFSLGNWAYWIIAIAALTTMFSTTVTVLDAYPRVMQPSSELLFPSLKTKNEKSAIPYTAWMLITIFGTLALLIYFGQSMRFIVDLATTISFVAAPVLAILNYKAVTHSSFPKESRPKKWLLVYAWIGMIFLSLFSVFYLIWRFIL
ncbi:MAG: Nramp family divalent metal transporter [Bacteroidales bacterium]|jgi:Mn2+/Fe2+ NRAMP family transporter|nr:Nramp family divalent metal transporter [Bacteroidales bacterium]